MATVQIQVKLNAFETITVPIDADEDIAALMVMIMSLRQDIGDGLKLAYKGRVLQEEDKVSSLDWQEGDFIVVSRKRSSEEAEDEAESQQPQGIAAADPSAVSSETLEELCMMGFDKGQAEKALRAAFNDLARAVEYLTEGIPSDIGATAAAQPAAAPAPPAAAAVAAAAPAPAAAPASNPVAAGWWESMFGNELLTKAGLQPTAKALEKASVVCIYFSAHWCGPCRQFTPRLAMGARSHQSGQIAIVFVSSDRSEQDFNSYYAEMPWLAVPYGAAQRGFLGELFQIKGIPSLVAVEKATQRRITTDARRDIQHNNFNFDMLASVWGVSPAPAATQVAAGGGYPSSSSAPEVAATSAKASPKEPEVLPIDDIVVDQALAHLGEETWEAQETFYKTACKVLENAMHNPSEAKYHQLKKSNAALSSKLLDVADGVGLTLMTIAGFESEEGSDVLRLASGPDGKCTALRDKLKIAWNKAWENQQRKERDERIAAELEKDKQRIARYGGSDGGRMELGKGRKPAGGGG